VNPAASRDVLLFIVAPRLETLYARVCMCFNAFNIPTNRACRCKQNARTGRVYTHTASHIIEFTESHWQWPNDKEKLSRMNEKLREEDGK